MKVEPCPWCFPQKSYHPNVLAGYTLLDDDGQPIASLLLGSPVDSRFLADIQISVGMEGAIIALVNPKDAGLEIYTTSPPESFVNFFLILLLFL